MPIPVSSASMTLIAVDAAGFLHPFRPQAETLIGAHRKLGDVGIIGAEPLVEACHEGLVDGVLQILEVIVADQHAIAFLRRQHDVLVANGEGGRGHRNALAHAGRRPLAVEGDMRAADQRRPHEIRLRRLDLGNGRAEIGDVQREEIDRGNLAAIFGDVFLHPLRGDLAVIVVGRDDIDLLAPLLHGVGHELFHRLRRGRRRCRTDRGRRRRLRTACCRNRAS